MKKNIPNFITSLNAFSGCIACVMAFQGEHEWVIFWVLVAALFDFTDGLSSRLLHAYSSMGKELDSLSDLISFGLAPSIGIFSLLQADNVIYPEVLIPIKSYIPYIAFLITVFSAMRLAKFNVDERQHDSFIGLATPANALFWTSFCAGIYKFEIIDSKLMLAIIGLVFVFSYLLVSEIPMFSLKKRKFRLKDNEQLVALAAFLIVSTYFLHFLGIAVSVLFYICLCCFFNKRNLTKEA